MRKDPTGRALHLLSLLQTHRFWRGADSPTAWSPPSARCDATSTGCANWAIRSMPRPGSSGDTGSSRGRMPPLVVDDDEAVALAVGLRYAAVAAIDGVEESSLRALTKIEALLPHRLRRRVSALHASVRRHPGPPTTTRRPRALSVLAAACRDHEVARFDYRAGDGTSRVDWSSRTSS